MVVKRNIVVQTSLPKDRKLDKTTALRSPRWIPFDGIGSHSEDGLAMPPALRTKLSSYIMSATSASTMDDDVSFATVQTSELGVPPIWERKRKQEVEFVDYELGQQGNTTTTTNVVDLAVSLSPKNHHPEPIPEENSGCQENDENSPPEEDAGTPPNHNHDELNDQRELDSEKPLVDIVEAVGKQVLEALKRATSTEGDKTPLVFFEPQSGNVHDPPREGHGINDQPGVGHGVDAVDSAVPQVDETTFHPQVDDIVVHDATINNVTLGMVSDGEDFLPPSPPHEILIDPNSSVVRSTLNDYHTEIDVLDELIEKYAGVLPKSDALVSSQQSNRATGEGTDLSEAHRSEAGELSGRSLAVAVAEYVPPTSAGPEATTAECSADPVESTPANAATDASLFPTIVDTTTTPAAATWSCASGFDSLANSAKSAIKEMFEKCTPLACGTSLRSMFSFDDATDEAKGATETFSSKTEDSSEQSYPSLRHPAPSRVNIGEPTFVSVQGTYDMPNREYTAKNPETTDVKGKGKNGKLAFIRKAFGRAFRREQKKQRRNLESEKATKSCCDRKPKARADVRTRNKGLLVKRWRWRGRTFHVHESRIVDSSAFEVKKPYSE